MENEMWQLARLLENCDIDGRRVFNVGDTIWVKVGPPVTARRRYIGKSARSGVSTSYDTNIQGPKGAKKHPLVACPADKIELQPVFQDSVVFISYDEMMNGQRS